MSKDLPYSFTRKREKTSRIRTKLVKPVIARYAHNGMDGLVWGWAMWDTWYLRRFRFPPTKWAARLEDLR